MFLMKKYAREIIFNWTLDSEFYPYAGSEDAFELIRFFDKDKYKELFIYCIDKAEMSVADFTNLIHEVVSEAVSEAFATKKRLEQEESEQEESETADITAFDEVLTVSADKTITYEKAE